MSEHETEKVPTRLGADDELSQEYSFQRALARSVPSAVAAVEEGSEGAKRWRRAGLAFRALSPSTISEDDDDDLGLDWAREGYLDKTSSGKKYLSFGNIFQHTNRRYFRLRRGDQHLRYYASETSSEVKGEMALHLATVEPVRRRPAPRARPSPHALAPTSPPRSGHWYHRVWTRCGRAVPPHPHPRPHPHPHPHPHPIGLRWTSPRTPSA